jgi:hypothetical protein
VISIISYYLCLFRMLKEKRFNEIVSYDNWDNVGNIKDHLTTALNREYFSHSFTVKY